jgi:hypothetical protein
MSRSAYIDSISERCAALNLSRLSGLKRASRGLTNESGISCQYASLSGYWQSNCSVRIFISSKPAFSKNSRHFSGVSIRSMKNGTGGGCPSYRDKQSPNGLRIGHLKPAVTSLTKSLAREYKEYPISMHSVTLCMVSTDFVKNMKTSSKLSSQGKSMETLEQKLESLESD